MLHKDLNWYDSITNDDVERAISSFNTTEVSDFDVILNNDKTFNEKAKSYHWVYVKNDS